MVSNAILSALFGVPVIYCIVRLAGFKNRNKILWAILSIFASIPVSWLLFDFSSRDVISGLEITASIPIFIVLTLLPSNLSKADKETYNSSFTSLYKKHGYTALAIASVILIGLFYFGLYSEPLIPAFKNFLIHVHVPLGLIAYGAVLATLILSVIRLVVNSPIPRVLIGFQLLSLGLFYLCVISGSIWAHIAWGRVWGWDPKETWSLILLFVMVGTTTYLICCTPNKVKMLLILCLQVFVAVIVFLIVPLLLPGLHTYKLL